MKIEEFIQKYPVSLRQVMATPMIFRGTSFAQTELPWPSINHIRDLAEFAGFSYGALRTALSRAVLAGDILSFKDDSGRTRYRMTAFQEAVSQTVQEKAEKKEGLTLAVFSFRTDEEKARAGLRQLLHWWGFKMLAPNVYIAGRMDIARVQKSADEAGFGNHLFLFECPQVSSDRIAAKIREAFDVENHVARTRDFIADVRKFLDAAREPIEFGRRAFYCGPVHHDLTFLCDLPLPPQLLPKDYPLEELNTVLFRILTDRFQDLTDYYFLLEKQGEEHE
jgi:DNA-binding transcriptional regulator PaaX